MTKLQWHITHSAWRQPSKRPAPTIEIRGIPLSFNIKGRRVSLNADLTAWKYNFSEPRNYEKNNQSNTGKHNLRFEASPSWSSIDILKDRLRNANCYVVDSEPYAE